MEQYSRRELLDAFVNFTGTEGDTDQRRYAEQVLRRAYLSLWLAHPWHDHRLPSPIQLTTVAGTRTYALPTYFGRLPPRVTHLRNLTTGGPITIVSLDELQAAYPETGTTLETAGVPRLAAIGGPVGVSVQPPATGASLQAVSTDAADTTVCVTVEGITLGGIWDQQQVDLLPPGGAILSRSADPLFLTQWIEVINFTKAYEEGTEPPVAGTSSTGTVSLRVGAAGAILESLLPHESAREFPSLILYPKPATAGEIIAVPGLRGPKRLLFDADEIPRFWSEALLERMKQLSKVSDGDPGALLPLGPEAVKLVAFDNSQQTRLRTRPFRG